MTQILSAGAQLGACRQPEIAILFVGASTKCLAIEAARDCARPCLSCERLAIALLL